MLKRLYISNFALIQEMDVSFPGGLTVITGETGAGKSIFLEALGLALGKRADLAALKNKNKKCIIEAEFDTSAIDLAAFFDESGIEHDNQVILRREINADGKSRSFLNDSVINLNALKFLAAQLIDIHSQHQTLLLNDGDFQMGLLDAFANAGEMSLNYRAGFVLYQEISRRIRELRDREQVARKEMDYYQFLYSELDEAGLAKGQLQQLEEEGLALENAEAIRSGLARAAAALTEGDNNVLSHLSAVKQSLLGISRYSPLYQQQLERANAAYIELKDLGMEIDSSSESVSIDDKRLEEVNGKIDRISRLLKKHNVKSEDELIQVRSDIDRRLLEFSSLEDEIQRTEKELLRAKSNCEALAGKLSEQRKKAVPEVEKQVMKMLHGLSMENAVFSIEIVSMPELSLRGTDHIRFLFSANKGMPVNDLNKVASGGELSRLMLTLKALLAEKKQLPSIIFDEIDTGVSGDVADKIGNILFKMGKKLQVVVITHLPQMASKGNHHLFVYKKDNEDQTVSHIRELNTEERITEIAKMLSTSKPTESALKNAKELLNA